MRRSLACVILLFSALELSAQDGWVLYAPNQLNISETEGEPGKGAEYVASLLGGYVAQPTTVEEAREACVERLRGVVAQLGHSLNGFAYDMSISVQAAVPPFEGVSCRISAQSDLSVTIEVKEE